MSTEWKYMIAHGFPDGTRMASLINNLRDTAIASGAKGEIPKMGTHLTVLPPFYADEKSIVFAASLMKAILALYGVSILTCKKVNIFPKAEGEAASSLHLEVMTDSKYKEYISWLKANNPFEWVHPPLTSSPVEPIYTPHISILLLEEDPKDSKEFLKRVGGGILFGKEFELPPPMFFKKRVNGEGLWQQVIV